MRSRSWRTIVAQFSCWIFYISYKCSFASCFLFSSKLILFLSCAGELVRDSWYWNESSNLFPLCAIFTHSKRNKVVWSAVLRPPRLEASVQTIYELYNILCITVIFWIAQQTTEKTKCNLESYFLELLPAEFISLYLTCEYSNQQNEAKFTIVQKKQVN